MHACLLHVYACAFTLSIYLMLIIMGIGHGFVHVHLYSNKDRLLSRLRQPFGNVTFLFISSRMAFSLLTDSFL
jgi:hypothetical protein